MNPDSTTWRCPSCSTRLSPDAVLCTRCGFDRRAGRCIGPTVLPAGLTPPPVSDEVAKAPPAIVFRRAADPKIIPWFEVGAPLLGLLLAMGVLGVHAAMTPRSELGRELLRIGLLYFCNVAVLIACVLIASHWGAIEFGHVHRGILKCSAVVLLTLAVMVWVEPFVANVLFKSLPPGSPAIGAATMMLTIAIQLLLPLPLLKFFFQLDLSELMMVVAAQFVVTYASTLLLGLLL